MGNLSPEASCKSVKMEYCTREGRMITDFDCACT